MLDRVLVDPQMCARSFYMTLFMVYSRCLQFAEDSGWEDNNVFQSGAESSSPARPPPKPRTRKAAAPKASTATRKSSRKATSAPPEYLSSSSPSHEPQDVKEEHVDPIVSPPRSKFAPHLSPEAIRENDNIISGVPRSPFKFLTSPFKAFSPLAVVETRGTIEEADEEDVGEEILDQIVEEQAIAAIADDAQEDASESDELDELDESEDGKQYLADSRNLVDDAVVRPSRPVPRGTGSLLRFVVAIASFMVYMVVSPYKAQSAALGYCETGINTNDILERLRTRNAAIEACNRDNRTSLYLPTPGVEEQPCPAPPLLPFIPDECTPCPEHATCTPDSVSCEHGFLLRPHPLLAFISLPSSNTLSPHSQLSPSANAVLKFIEATLDGMPGVGPVALPPRCIEDPKRKRHIGVLGKAIEAVLGLEHGKRLCADEVSPVQDIEGGEARRWGMDLNSLREAMKTKTAVSCYRLSALRN